MKARIETALEARHDGLVLHFYINGPEHFVEDLLQSMIKYSGDVGVHFYTDGPHAWTKLKSVVQANRFVEKFFDEAERIIKAYRENIDYFCKTAQSLCRVEELDVPEPVCLKTES